MKVLVVDDEPIIRAMLKAQFEAKGVLVIDAKDGRDALQILELEVFDAVVSDVLMPIMDGYRLCAEIRSNLRLAFTPFIIYTATFTSIEEEQFARDLGADRYIRKPAEFQILYEAVKQAISERPAGVAVHSTNPRKNELVERYGAILAQKLEEKHRALQQQSGLLNDSQSQSRLLAAIINSSDDAIISKKLNGTILSWNKGATHLYGYSEQEMVGHCISILIPPDRQHEYRDIIRQAKSGLASKGLETVRIRKDGTLVDVSIRASPIRNQSGQVFGVSVIARDISNNKELRRKLQDSEAELRALAARLETIRENEAIRIAREVHDHLGQALTALNMDLVWLEKKLASLADPALAQSVFARLKMMSELVASTAKTVQRISTELRPGILDDLGLTAALEWWAEEFQNRSAVKCEWNAPPKPVAVSQELATAVFRIFQEILTNVSRHSGATRIDLSLTTVDGMLCLVVSDNGKGFPVGHAGKRNSLGLLGMRERATLVGGRVEIESEPGRGATVRVTVPSKADIEAAPNTNR